MNHNMQSNIGHTLIQHLLTEAQRDSVQKLVVGAVICKNNKFLLLEFDNSTLCPLTPWVDLLNFQAVL